VVWVVTVSVSLPVVILLEIVVLGLVTVQLCMSVVVQSITTDLPESTRLGETEKLVMRGLITFMDIFLVVDPPELVHLIAYPAVANGDTVALPEVAFPVGNTNPVQPLVALRDDHVSIVEPPLTIVLEAVVRVAVGGGGTQLEVGCETTPFKQDSVTEPVLPLLLLLETVTELPFEILGTELLLQVVLVPLHVAVLALQEAGGFTITVAVARSEEPPAFEH